jgi:serine/threonine protein phosphatase PrpC
MPPARDHYACVVLTEVSCLLGRFVLVLGTDGVWETVKAEDAVELAAKHAADGGTNPAECIVDHAIAEHSLKATSDNVTAIVVFLATPVAAV